MASTNKTTNYELSQFIETDRPAWLTDYNGDMRIIDSTMKAISDVASGASGSITDLSNRMTNAEGNIITNANDIDALEARADALEAGAQSTAGTIAGIQTEQTAQNMGIEAATQLAYNIARPYDAASTYEVGDYVIFQNTLYKCVTAVPVGEAFVPAKWLAIKVMDEIGAGGVSPSYLLDDQTAMFSNFSSTTATLNNPSVLRRKAITIGGLTIFSFSIVVSFTGIASSHSIKFDLDYQNLTPPTSPVGVISTGNSEINDQIYFMSAHLTPSGTNSNIIVESTTPQTNRNLEMHIVCIW